MDITIKVNEKQVAEAIVNSPDIREEVSGKLYQHFIDAGFNEIKREYKEIAREIIRGVVKDYVENYYEEYNIRRDVESIIKSMTKKDVIELSYFRKNGKVMTLNSNQRRFCSGCKFCGVSQQESRYLASLLDRDLLEAYFEELSQTCNFEELEEIALCTGCFPKEKYLVEHLYDIHDVASEHGFGGEIKFIGSELSRDGLKEIARKIPDFSYYFTIEVFTNRDIFLNPKKRVPLDEIERTLQFAKNQGFDTSFLYIIGLEPLEIYERGLRRFKKDVTRFPVINIFQNYHKEQEKHRVGKTLDYYLKARKIAESVFEDTDLKPRVWECYRSLWYSEYRGEKLDYDLQTFESGY